MGDQKVHGQVFAVHPFIHFSSDRFWHMERVVA